MSTTYAVSLCYLDCVQKEMVGLAEAAELAGVSRQTFWSWKNSYENFPEPIVELKSGPIWEKDTMVAWLKARTAARKMFKRKKKA